VQVKEVPFAEQERAGCDKMAQLAIGEAVADQFPQVVRIANDSPARDSAFALRKWKAWPVVLDTHAFP
jgi:hypothetical protein